MQHIFSHDCSYVVLQHVVASDTCIGECSLVTLTMVNRDCNAQIHGHRLSQIIHCFSVYSVACRHFGLVDKVNDDTYEVKLQCNEDLHPHQRGVLIRSDCIWTDNRQVLSLATTDGGKVKVVICETAGALIKYMCHILAHTVHTNPEVNSGIRGVSLTQTKRVSFADAAGNRISEQDMSVELPTPITGMQFTCAGRDGVYKPSVVDLHKDLLILQEI